GDAGQLIVGNEGQPPDRQRPLPPGVTRDELRVLAANRVVRRGGRRDGQQAGADREEHACRLPRPSQRDDFTLGLPLAIRPAAYSMSGSLSRRFTASRTIASPSRP